MKRNRENSVDGIQSQQIDSQRNRTMGTNFSTLWSHYMNPPEPPATASIFAREEARRGKIASIIVTMLLLSSLTILPIAFMTNNRTTILAVLAGTGICIVALFLNRRGAIKIAGVLILALIYGAQAYIVWGYSGGMTVGRLSLLDFTIIPSVVVLAFFPVNSLFLITGLDIVATWALVMFVPHNITITALLKTAPYQIFAHAYILQIIISLALYLWARSSEQAIRRADRAEEIVRLEKREKERQQQELERMHQLDTGIQAILQTHIAVANGDLSARAPLNQEHMLWQVAFALNNLIGRIQRLTNAESELKADLPPNTELTRAIQKRDLPRQPKQTEKMKAVSLPVIPPRMKRF